MNKWSRLEALIRWTGMSVNAFALNIGLKRAENLYQIKKGNNGISTELADLIVKKYPQVNKAWLLTGEGEMFRQDSLLEHKAIPCYDVLMPRKKSLKPSAKLIVPAFEDCDFAVKWNGNSMDPQIPGGAIVVVKQIEKQNILYGGTYMVVMDDLATVRDIRNVTGDEELIKLVPKNLVDFDEVVVARSQIQEIYMIKGVIYSLM